MAAKKKAVTNLHSWGRDIIYNGWKACACTFCGTIKETVYTPSLGRWVVKYADKDNVPLGDVAPICKSGAKAVNTSA